MKVIIVGARSDGHAKVVLEIINAQKKHTVVGFIDDDISKIGTSIGNIEVIGSMNDLPKLVENYNIEGGIVAIGNNLQRRSLSKELESIGIKLINAIHPTAHLDSDVIIGKGNYIGQGVILVTGTAIGNCVNIHTGATIDHDNIIDDGANIGPGVHTGGRVKIAMDAFLGIGTIVIPDGSIGEGSIVGAGTVVIRPVKPYTKVVGIPAKVIAKIK